MLQSVADTLLIKVIIHWPLWANLDDTLA
ncbi:uncharacterized protein METZ01_LOCUS31078 [marine metagenome]|uniref:Uncharacterized protein n=1 Tax=marine metagenome TaxID=408172 RepID=A0A381QH63_9ZZZZ